MCLRREDEAGNSQTANVFSLDEIDCRFVTTLENFRSVPRLTVIVECIAEFTGRPLLALTCGDIGTEEVEMEEKLRHWLELAYKWGAVMLIDEADVFLEKRQDSDLKRNSLVSGKDLALRARVAKVVGSDCYNSIPSRDRVLPRNPVPHQ